MEDNKQDQDNNAPQGGVMDVQPSQQPNQYPATPATPAPAQEAPAETSKPGLSPELLAQAEAETHKPEAKPTDQLLAAHASRRLGPKIAVVVAIVVAIALAGVAVYAYLQSQDKDTQDNHAGDTSHQELQGTQPATADEVEEAAKELDGTINATSEEQEIPGEGLSEESVGL